MTQGLQGAERYLVTYSEGDRTFAVAVFAPSFSEARSALKQMSRDERRRNIVSTMAAKDADMVEAMGNWLRRTFFSRVQTYR